MTSCRPGRQGSLDGADCWIEYNTMYILYSDTYEEVAHTNKKLRFLCLPGMHVDVFIRLFANTDHEALRDLLHAVRDKIRSAKHVRLTSTAGEDIEFDNHPIIRSMQETAMPMSRELHAGRNDLLDPGSGYRKLE